MLDTCTAKSKKKIFLACCLCWQWVSFFKFFKSTPLTTKSFYILKLLNSYLTVYLFPLLLFTTGKAEVDRSRLDVTLKLKKGRQLVGCASVTLKVSVNNLWSIGIVAVQLIYRQYINIHTLYLARSMWNASIQTHDRLEASELAASPVNLWSLRMNSEPQWNVSKLELPTVPWKQNSPIFDHEKVVFRFESVLDRVRPVFLSCLERNPRSCRQCNCATAA